MLLALILRHELQDFRVDLVLVEVDRRDSVLLREEARDLLVGDESELRERVTEVLPGAARLVLRLSQLREGDQLLSDEELAQPILVRHALESVGDDAWKVNDFVGPFTF